MRSDGSGQTRVSQGKGSATQPAWSVALTYLGAIHMNFLKIFIITNCNASGVMYNSAFCYNIRR